MTEEQLQQWAIRFIGIVDYDIQKECQYYIDEEVTDSLVAEMMNFIEYFINEVKKGTNE